MSKSRKPTVGEPAKGMQDLWDAEQAVLDAAVKWNDHRLTENIRALEAAVDAYLAARAEGR